jgi:hypothetical protein
MDVIVATLEKDDRVPKWFAYLYGGKVLNPLQLWHSSTQYLASSYSPKYQQMSARVNTVLWLFE